MNLWILLFGIVIIGVAMWFSMKQYVLSQKNDDKLTEEFLRKMIKRCQTYLTVVVSAYVLLGLGASIVAKFNYDFRRFYFDVYYELWFIPTVLFFWFIIGRWVILRWLCSKELEKLRAKKA